jgi:hypothetical protein
MPEPSENLPEQKPTPNQQAIEDLSWDIPFFRTFWNFFIQEGKAVKHGWVAVAIIAGISIWITHSCTKSGTDDKISNLKGQLTDAKQERDKYQMMLAPFEAYAIAKYTNAPLDQRLELYGQTLSAITNALASDKPVLHLEINGTKIGGYESPKPGVRIPSSPILLNTNRQIAMHIFNDSETTAEHISVDFIADIAPTNVLADQWILEPRNANGWNHWHLVATDSYGSFQVWFPQTIEISQNFKQKYLVAQFIIHADRSKSRVYSINCILQN